MRHRLIFFPRHQNSSPGNRHTRHPRTLTCHRSYKRNGPYVRRTDNGTEVRRVFRHITLFPLIYQTAPPLLTALTHGLCDQRGELVGIQGRPQGPLDGLAIGIGAAQTSHRPLVMSRGVERSAMKAFPMIAHTRQPTPPMMLAFLDMVARSVGKTENGMPLAVRTAKAVRGVDAAEPVLNHGTNPRRLATNLTPKLVGMGTVPLFALIGRPSKDIYFKPMLATLSTPTS
jgi:hypothetical protein